MRVQSGRIETASGEEGQGFHFADSCFVRSAALPFEAIRDWSTTFDTARSQCSGSHFEAPDEFVQRQFASKEGLLALRLASPSLYRQFLALRDGRTWDRKKLRRIDRALTRYFLRWACRATPFGLFSSVATLSRRGEPILPEQGFFLQIDQTVIEKLWREGTEPVEEAFSNPTLHEIDDRTYFFVYDPEKNTYALCSVDDLDEELVSGRGQVMASGNRRRSIEEALDDGSMVRPWAPRAIGPSPLAQTIAAARSAEKGTEVAQRFERICALEGLYDSADSLGTALDQLGSTLRAAPGGPPRGPLANVTRLGCPDDPTAALPPIVEDLSAALPRLLDVLWHPNQPDADHIHRLFMDRFGGEPVTVLEFASQVLWPLQHERSSRGKATGGPQVETGRVQAGMDPPEPDRVFERWAFRALEHWPADNELRIDTAEASEVRGRQGRPLSAQSGYLLVSRVRTGNRARTQVKHVVGPSALSLLGRFTFASPRVRRLAANIADEEQAASSGVVCDVSFLPSYRRLNVVCRSPLHRAEIGLDRPVLAAASAKELNLRELYLIDDAGRLGLFCAELGRRVHPRICCSYNYRLLNDTVFQILAAVQNHEDRLSRVWHWGLQGLRPRMPRVCFEDLILCPASWRIGLSREERAELRGGGDAERAAFVSQLRAERGLPQLVNFGLFDQRMLFDLENPRCRALLAESLASRAGDLMLEEAFEPEESHVQEIAIPFWVKARTRDEFARGTESAQRPMVTPSSRRRKESRSWASIELYGQYRDFDELLPICWQTFGELRECGIAKRWFFVRYNDPSPHLRYRIEVEPGTLHSALSHARERFDDRLAHGTLSEIRTVAYTPEFQRYGGADCIGYAHEVFWRDSELAVSLQPLFAEHSANRSVLLASCLFLDRVFQRLDLSVSQRCELAKALAEPLSREFPGTPSSHWTADYRQNRVLLVPLIGGDTVEPLTRDAGLVVRVAALEIGSIMAEYSDRIVQAHGARKWTEVMWSILHMHINRAFEEDWRRLELRVLELLARTYAEIWHRPQR